MKTLDEVIKGFECCELGSVYSLCESCPYAGIGSCNAEIETDALHYLKEFRAIKNTHVYIPEGYITAKIGDKNR